MSDRGWIIATIIMLALGAYFVVDGHSRDHARGLPVAIQTESPDGDGEK